MGKYQRLIIRGFIGLLLLCLPVSAFGADQVTLQLIWKHQFQFAGYYVAKELGFYEDAGLDVTIKEYAFGTDVTAEVVSGKAHFGVGRSSLILERMEGQPVFLLSAIFQHSPFMLLAKDRDDLRAVTDLKNKRIMVTDDVVGMASLTAMLTGNGIRPGDYISQKHTFSVDDLISGKTDAVAAYTSNEPFQMQQRGVDYTIFAPKDHGFDFYSDLLFTSQQLYQDNPQLVERFRQASLRGWAYAFAHIDEAIEIILKDYNTQNRGQDALRFEADTLKMLAYDGAIPLGRINRIRLEQIAQVYRLLGLTIKPLNLDDLFYDSAASVQLDLTPEEKSWLAAHRKIVVGGETDWAPFDFVDEDGKYAGIANDYLKIIGQKLGIEVEMVTGPSWDELLEMLRRKEIDVLPAIYHSAQREAFVHFTTPYLKITEFIFARSDNQTISSFADLKDKTTVVVKGYTIESSLRSNHPDYDLITAPTIQDALKKLIIGDADAFIGDIISTSYNIKEHSLVGIRPIAPITDEGPTVHMAVRKDWPVLRNLIDKTLTTIPDREHDTIKNQWISFAEKKIVQSGPKVALTAKEQKWIKQHPVIRVHNEKDWPPFNYFEFGRPRGLSIDYMDLLAEKLGIEVEYLTGPSWDDFLGLIKRKELDVMLNIVKTEDRQTYLLFTEPYVKNPNVIASLNKSAYGSIEQLFGKTVAFPKGFFYEEVLTKSFPQIKRLPVADTLTSLKAVAFGRADAALGEAAVIRTLISKNMLAGLEISGEVKLGNPDLTNLRLGVRNDWPLLQSALMKAMAEVTPQEMNRIRQQWLMDDKRQIDTKEVSLADAPVTNITIPLTAAEKAWLAEHPKIRFTGDPDWLPQEAFTSEGQYIGIVADILDLLEARLGIQFERVPVKTWNEAVRLAESAGVDVLSETTSSERDTLTFTKPYLVFPVVILAKQGTPSISNPKELKGKRVAVVKDYGYVVPFRRQFPDLDYVVVETVRDGLLRLSAGQVDAFLSAAPTASHLMSELGLTNLKFIGSTELSIDLGLGVRKDIPVLVGILNKALADITEEEKLNIRQKWVPVIETAAPQPDVSVSYRRLLVYGLAVFIILSLLAWILIRSIWRENIAVSFGSPWFRGLVLAGLSAFVLIVAFVGWYLLERNKTEHLLNVDENLRGVISVSQDRLDLWLQERLSFLAHLGRDPKLVAITQRLLQVRPNKRALLASGALREARFFFDYREDIFQNIGFFVINPDHVSIGSMRDANLGTQNLISKQYPELLQQAFQGKVGFVPPMTSDVDLGNSSPIDKALKPTMFFIGPIQNTDGRVLAVMTLRVDPWKDFALALRSFGGSASRQSYAFDRNGILLSPSRFEEQLRRIGLLAKDQGSALNIEIRDPGGNMTEGHQPAIEISQQPLTQMVSEALALRQQMETAGRRQGWSPIASNLEGYRDYRGVPVFGTWLWNADLGLGLAVEVDVDEALSHYYRSRNTIFGILGFTLLLSVGAILFVLIIGERTSRALMRARDNLECKVAERTAELQEKQKQLAEAEERARLLLDSAGEGIFGVDVEGKLAFINPAASRLLGYAPDDLIGEGVHEKIHYAHEDGSDYPKEDCPMYRSYTEGTNHHINDEVLWCKDGTPFPVEYTSMPLHKDGQVVGAVVTFMDITERKQMEAKLAAEQQRLQGILDSSPVSVGISVEGVIQYGNAHMSDFFGIKKGDRPINIYADPQDLEFIVQELERTGTVRNYELKVYNAHGEVCDLLSNYNKIEYKGQSAILAWWTDVTEIKATSEELKSKFDELARFRRMAIGRELKMIELKKEINAFLTEGGFAEKYKIHGKE
jgi:PAS domain S-box-containing protein